MNQFDLEAMSRQELRAYLLEHREDEEAYQVYIQKVKTEPAKETFPAPQSIEDLQHFPRLLKQNKQQ